MTAAMGAAVLTGALALPQPALAAHEPVRLVASDLVGPTHVDVVGGTAYVAEALRGGVSAVDLATGAVRPVASVPGFAPGVGVQRGEVLVAASTEETTGLFRVARDGSAHLFADLLQHELDHNPDGQDQDAPDAVSNPYAVLALPGRTLVADAAANAVLFVTPNGKVRTLAVLPLITDGDCADVQNNGGLLGCDPVPTDIALGRDGHLYVSGLGGEVEGHVWKLNQGGKVVQTWSDLPPLTGVAVDDRGTVYASSLFTGTVLRLPAGGGAPTGAVQLPSPTGLDLERGTLYATSVDLESGAGELYAVPLSAFHPLP